MPNLFVEMEVSPVTANGSPAKFVFEKTVSLSAAGESPAIIIPYNESGITRVQVVVSGGGQGKVQSTIDTINTVKNGTVNWVDWDSGVVSVNVQDSAYSPTAIRLAQTSVGGTVSLLVRA